MKEKANGLALSVILALVAPCALARDADHVMKLDVVALVNGEEIKGRPDIALDRGKFTYYFVSEENRAAFEANPEQYEIQLGGACGSMGPLSGEGRTDLYSVYDGRVYLFASEGCRTRFLRTPERLIDHDDPEPWLTAESGAAARQILERAIEAIGGPERVRELRSIRFVREWDDEKYHRIVRWTFVLPDVVEKWSAWDDYEYSVVTSPDEGWFTYDDGSIHMLEPAQRAVLSRQIAYNPMTILARLDEPGAMISKLGEEKIAMPDGSEVIVDLVAVARNGVTTTLGVDQETGRTVIARYRGRGAGAYVGYVQHTYSDFREVEGLTLPFQIDTTFDGRPYAEESGRFSMIEINRDEHHQVLERPQNDS